MKAEELRRLSQEAVERKAAEERDRVNQAKTEKGRASQREFDKQWERARRAVLEIDRALRKAADQGKREAVIYAAFENEFLKIEHFEKYSWWDGSRTKEWYKFNIPAYAKFVFDHCPPQLNPRWEGHCFYRSSGPVTDGGSRKIVLEDLPYDEVCDYGVRKLMLKVTW